MIKANIASGLADLAEAAYVDFKNVELGGLGGTALINAFRDEDNNVLPAWPESRRAAFAAEWRVVAHMPNTSSGFSATVFERIAPKTGESRYVFAARGTEELLNDLLRADLADLVANGLAWEQVIDLYNWWNELTTPLGGTYQRATAVRVSDALAGQPNTIVEAGQLWRIDLTPTTQSATPRIPAGSVVDVTGHSLGGHLATAFSRLFTANTANVVTINGAGYSVAGVPTGNTSRLFATLGGQATFPASQILNIYGDRGPELVTQNSGLVQPGAHLQARIEDWNALTNMLGQPCRPGPRVHPDLTIQKEGRAVLALNRRAAAPALRRYRGDHGQRVGGLACNLPAGLQPGQGGGDAAGPAASGRTAARARPAG